jgi:hypothetical protein
MGTLHEDLCTFVVVFFRIILRMRNVSDKSCGEIQNTFYIWEPFSENRAVYEILWKNKVQPHWSRMRI